MIEGFPKEKEATQGTQGQEIYNGPEGLQELYRDKLTHGRVAALIKVVLSDPTARALFYENFKDKDILKSSGADPGKFSSRVSALMVSLMRNISLRGLLMESVLGDMREESAKRKSIAGEFQKEGTDRGRELKTQTYNRVVIGGGGSRGYF